MAFNHDDPMVLPEFRGPLHGSRPERPRYKDDAEREAEERRPGPGESGHCPSCKHNPPPHRAGNLCEHPDEQIRNMQLPEQDENRCSGYEFDPDWESRSQ